MKTASKTTKKRINDDLLPHYDLDYSKGKKNPYAKYLQDSVLLVPISDDVATVFKDADSVNNALRAFISAIPKQNSRVRRARA